MKRDDMFLSDIAAMWRGMFAWQTRGQKVRTCVVVAVFLWIFVYLFFIANSRVGVYRYTPKTMTTLSGKTQTHCIGRYLIDMPVELGRFETRTVQFIYGLGEDWDDVTLEVKREDYSRDQFMRESKARMDDLANHRNDWGGSKLLNQEVLETPNGKALLLRYLNRGSVSARINNELHILVGYRYAVIEGKSYHLSDPEPEGTIQKPLYTYIDSKPTEDRLRTIAQNIKGYTDAAKAPEGFCLAGVVMNNKTMGYDIEKAFVESDTDSTALPWTRLTMSMQDRFGHEDPSLIVRVEKANAELASAMANEGKQWVSIRKGPIKINAIPSLEYADATHSRDAVSFQFMAETNLPEKQQSLQRPFFTMNLEVGGLDKNQASPLTRDQAIEMWDGLLKTMRLSPANGGNRLDPQTGSLVPETKVGQACPKSGVWAASLPNTHPSARNLASAPQRFVNVRQGQSMPEVYAKFMFPQTADADNAAITWTWFREA